MQLTRPENIQELFQTYQLDNKDEIAGQQINDSQRAYLHNLRALKAESLLNLLFDAKDIVKYAQDEAFLQGQIQILNELLTPPVVLTEEDN